MFGLLGRGAIEGMMDEDPRRQGLLSAALAGLAASGPSSKPVSLGQTLGMAGNQGLQTMREGQQFQTQREMRDMQMQQMRMQQTKMQEEMAQAAQQRQVMQNFAAQLPEADRTAFLANPQAFMQERNKRYTVGGNLVDGSGKPMFTAPERPQLVELPVPGQPGVTQKAWMRPGESTGTNVGGMKMPEILNPQVQAAKRDVAAAGASRNNTTVISNQEKEESKVVGKAFGEQYADIQKAGFNAQSGINRAQRLGQLLENVNTGKLTPAGTELAAFAESLGFKIDKNLGNKQAANALSNEIALQLRNPAGGAGMPGALSDKDREFLVSMVPGLATSPEGRKTIIETMVKIAKRDQQVAQMARDYRKKNGQLNEGFYDELAAFSAKNPLFTSGTGTNATSGGISGFKVLGVE
jgi:hypothetical protein